ncbi:hypothetical protein D3OALGA1CA_4082 [Olavius algarvensis associated proteobacterium Delta 3]|nr:hypothetical protein D3OALGA1CA_4082 [Olavius algarvensis associated proteobacterium Delta 3]
MHGYLKIESKYVEKSVAIRRKISCIFRLRVFVTAGSKDSSGKRVDCIQIFQLSVIKIPILQVFVRI